MRFAGSIAFIGKVQDFLSGVLSALKRICYHDGAGTLKQVYLDHEG
ncbi:MAG: hypothetical protein ACTSYS_01105 [Promethearchaeota archaeon]